MHQLFQSTVLAAGLLVGTIANAEDLTPFPEYRDGTYDELLATIEAAGIQMQMGNHSQNHVYNSAMANQLFTIVLQLRYLEAYQNAATHEGAVKLDGLLEISNMLDVWRAEYDAEAALSAQSATKLGTMLGEVVFPSTGYDKFLEEVEK